MEAQPVKPAVGIAKGLKDCIPTELFVVSGIAVGCESGLDELPFCGSQKSRGAWIVLDEPKCCHSHKNCCNSFLGRISAELDDRIRSYKNKNPPPTIFPHHASHFSDSLHMLALPLTDESPAYICEDPSKSSCKRCRTEEKRDSVLSLTSFIPHGKVKDDSGEKPTFGDSEEETGNQKSCQVLDHTQECCNDAPGDCECR